MYSNKTIQFITLILIIFMIQSCKKETGQTSSANQKTKINQVNGGVSKIMSATMLAPSRIFSSGLNNPRGLKFGPDGNLYVAEGGLGGTNSTVGFCTQVVAPVGPYTSSNTTGRI